MSFQLPHEADTFTLYAGDFIHTEVSLAIQLIDDFTGEAPLGNIVVKVHEGNLIPLKNISGYYVFINLTKNQTYNIHIDSEFYFPEQIDDLTIPRPDPKNPLEVVTLKPKPAYPFPANATLIRGMIVNPEPIQNVLVKTSDPPQETKTDKSGEFVLYFKGIKEKEITITIKALVDKIVAAKITEGRTTSVGRIDFF